MSQPLPDMETPIYDTTLMHLLSPKLAGWILPGVRWREEMPFNQKSEIKTII